jgi:glycosyltransferase involved in cell wall biosynthesis
VTLATVLVPTYNHGPTLSLSVGSALAQTVEDIEVMVVGDGATAETREAAGELERADSRVRFLDFSKGERHGERNRHLALEEARGRIVCYLADDDLWLSDHVAYMAELLDAADFSTGVRVMVHTNGEHEIELIDLGVPYVRERILAATTNVALTCVAHTRLAYRQLPVGWRPAPEELSPTLYMWQQFVASPGLTAVAGTRVTSLNFPDLWRADWPIEDRFREIVSVAERLADPAFRAELGERALQSALHKWARTEQHLHDLELHLAHLNATIESLETGTRLR